MKSNEVNEELRCFDYFGLRSNPFPVVPDVDNFYLCDRIDRIVTEIVHGIVTRKGFLVLTGEVGLGKTTISRRVLSILEDEGVNTSLVFHTFCQGVELLREINRDLGLQSESLVLSDQMKALNDFLLAQQRQGKNSAIIIDDAQNLNHESLELVRTVSNLETNREKLVQVLLVGQPELIDKLNSPNLRQLKSRVMVSEEVVPLDKEELRGYIMFKLYMAGNAGTISVKKSAIKKVYKLTRGNFRQVNKLMERCLYIAFLHDKTLISRMIVAEAQKDLHRKTSGLFGRRVAWGLVATFVLYVTGWILFPGKPFNLSWLMSDSYSNVSGARSEDEVIKYKGIIDRGPEGYSTERPYDKPNEGKLVPEAILSFLQAYDLSDFAQVFYEALETNRLDEVAGFILEQTGYQMVELREVSDSIQDSYGLLRLSSGSTGRERHLVFWKPEIRITKFYLGYEGEEIAKLEELLAAVELYDYALDGLVGSRLMRAVNYFQEDNGLTVTGFPDEKTIFLLCHTVGGRYL
ncbi:MAG: AAA family ATPase [Deltaproteobacteria bacterium]|nr:AAA family ATPase [Deltaproteobacteria bacterium]